MRLNVRSFTVAALLVTLVGTGLAGCSNNEEKEVKEAGTLTLEEITAKAKEEGEVVSVGMPDSWANWKDTWADLTREYGLKHSDTDMSSAEEIAKFEAEKENATADIGDVGIAFGPIAEQKGVTQPYKTSYWDEIPDWAKDDNGDWIVGYTGSIAVITDKTKVKTPPKTWADIKNGDFKVAVGDVVTAAQAQAVVLSAAMVNGGDEKNIQPGVDFFADIAKQGRLAKNDVSTANIEKGEIEVAFLWDFNALNYRDMIDPNRFEVTILEEGGVVSGYATIINKYAKHPHAAMLTREYILSDKGQINLAKGYARPIRPVELPADVQAKLLPANLYTNVKPIKDFKAWEATAKELPMKWQQEVLLHAQ
ncbi:MAG: ABC transporter substrate-binding protein [Bacilli bacterium]